MATYIDPGNAIGISILVGGSILIAWGFYLRRHDRLRNLQGAAVLAAFAIVLGFAAIGVGAIFIARTTWG